LKKLWKIISVVLVIASISVVAGIAFYAFYGPPPISLILDIEQEYCSAEPVTFEAGLRNNAPFPVTLTFSWDCEILLWIEDEDGNIFYPSGPREWEAGQLRPWGADFSFAPFEEHRLKFNWTGEPGEYTLKVITPWLYYRDHNYRVYINHTTTFTILP